MGQSNAEIAKRLGRLAWKSINTVIELTEQKCMELDFEYSLAVNNLCMHKCVRETQAASGCHTS